jgi:hypothetical protein
MTSTIKDITHPIALETIIEANKPQCPCKGASYARIVGRIKKVITNHSGYWYYLDTKVTVPAHQVIRIL